MQMLKNILCAAVLACMLSLCVFATDTVIYLADGATGDGSSASSPVGSLTDAYALLGEEDATIVICGKYTVGAAFIAPNHTGKVTVTSVFGGVNYTKTKNASLTLAANFYIGGETLFDNIKVVSAIDYPGLFGNYKKMTIGKNVTCAYDEAHTTTYPCIVGGNYYSAKNVSGEVVINGGTWQRVRLANSVGSPQNANVTLTINGGVFNELIYLSGGESHNGNLSLIVNGGDIRMGIVGTSMALKEVTDEDGNVTYEDSRYYSGNMTITINGGNISGRIRPQYTKFGTLSGSWNIVINGGEFSHCAEIVGTADISTEMTSSLVYGPGIDINEEETGTYSFTNPIRYWGADPWLFFYDGAYYYITTGGNNLMLYKAANIGDLSNAAGTVIYDPEDGKEWSCNMWSPEIHYFSADMVGAANAGWYLFLCSDDGGDWNYSGMRAYVVKCLDGDNLMGRWGHPITGEVNVPQKVIFKDSDYNENELCGGMSVIVVNGQPYLTFVSEVGRDTSNFYQTLNIAKFENPWTIVGTPTVFCTPTYDWEKYGGGDGVHPYTVECSTAVYGKDGSIYIAYAGSAYWTPYYCIGELKLVGDDPMVASNWKKKSTPIFAQSDEVNGCGHASFVTDTDGNGWACYHGYITAEQTERYAFCEPYSVGSSGLTIGNGTKKPAPLSTKYTVNVNPTPISGKLSGFTTLNVNTVTADGKTTVRFNPVEDAAMYIVRRDGKLLGTITDNYFVDSEATFGWHTYKVDAVKGGIIATATAQGVSYNGLTYSDVQGDGDIDLADALVLLKDIINGVNENATIIDVVRILRCL